MLDTLLGLRDSGHSVCPVVEDGGLVESRLAQFGFVPLTVAPFAEDRAAAAAAIAKEVNAQDGPHIVCATGRHDAAVMNVAMQDCHRSPMTVFYRLSAFPLEKSGDAKEFAERADLVIATSVEQANRLFNHKELHKNMVIVTSGVDRKFIQHVITVDPEVARSELGIPVDAFVFTVSSRLSWEKGIDRVIRAMVQVSKAVDDAVLLLTGDGPEREKLEQLVRELDLSGRTLFTGHLPDVSPALAATDVAVLSTVVPEPQPLALKEAMAVAKPVIASRTGGIPEFVTDGDNGLLVSDDAELVEAMLALTADRERAKKMGRRAQETIIGGHLFEQRIRHLAHCLDRQAIRKMPLTVPLDELVWDDARVRDEENGGFVFVPRTSAISELSPEIYRIVRDSFLSRTPKRLLGLPKTDVTATVEMLHEMGALMRPTPPTRAQ
ncbi:glycosyltransferase family 4 protein [Streptomyces niger]|uniref:glycosyltransferase family 4 protein n=1 Tax=Streptomyces niger TaxID=66373 RepID=UPI00069C6427|nr:glycosyltransferase family 4 protein [Streptomyces niger]